MYKPADPAVDVVADDVDAFGPATLPPAAPMPKPSQSKKKRSAKLFVLDTNVLMHDPTSLFRWELNVA